MDIDHPKYKSIGARLNSFADWPRNKSQNRRDLSTAGFFYSGVGDRVVCFSCGGGLRDWRDGDDPWEQHAVFLSKCKFLKSIKGEDFILNVKNSNSNTIQSKQSENKKISEDKLCKICYENEYEVLLIPCGHVVVCKNCSLQIDKCPFCRAYISNKIKCYFP